MSSRVGGQGKMNVQTQEEREGIHPSSAFLFYPGPSTYWMASIHMGEGRSSLLSLVITVTHTHITSYLDIR